MGTRTIEKDIRALGWAFAQAGVANITGSLIDKTFVKVDALNQLPTLGKVMLQFGGGVLVLGAAIRAIVPAGEISPIGDAIMIYWFYDSQTNMRREIAVLRGDLYSNLSVTAMPNQPPAALQSSTFQNVDAY